jgi:hypothetical protein
LGRVERFQNETCKVSTKAVKLDEFLVHVSRAALERQQGNTRQWSLPKKVCAVVLVWSSRREDIDVAAVPNDK